MSWVIVGLGNPGVEYEGTRHNTGRLALAHLARTMDFGDLRADKRLHAHIARGMIDRTAVVLVAPDTFMNKSGEAVAKFIRSRKAAERMIVVHDDLDLPLGAMKISFDRGSGGHKGLESVMRVLKTKKFARVRIGISPRSVPEGAQKPSGEKEVNDFILSTFSSRERAVLQLMLMRVAEAIDIIVREGPAQAMNRFN